ncbi:MAG: signal peptide peptidase SppA, partial [Pedobacter sp.]|nr:signal peptide peptidase SppA [Pedobacter sp.]
ADRLGSFKDAIAAAAKKAKLSDYKVVEYPEKIDPLKSLLANAKENISIYYTKKELGENYLLYKQMQKAITNSGIQAKMDYEIKIK